LTEQWEGQWLSFLDSGAGKLTKYFRRAWRFGFGGGSGGRAGGWVTPPEAAELLR
jgi:hypothetical protein